MTFSNNKQLSEALKIVQTLSSQARVELFKDTRYFPVFFAYYFTEYVQRPFAGFHFDMFNDLNDLDSNLIREIAWVIYRESAKTSLAKGFLLYLIATQKRHYINVDAFDGDNSENVVYELASVLTTNKKFIEDYGILLPQKKAQDMSIRRINKFITTTDIMVEAHTTQESVRGRLYKHYRPDFVLLDDFETNKTKDSKAYTQQVQSHINELVTGLAPDAWIMYLCNYITEFGSVAKIVERGHEDQRLRVRMVNAINDSQPTWPEKFAMTDLEASQTGKVSLEDKKRQFGASVFAAEMMNDPVDEENAIFKKEYFKTFAYEDLEYKYTRNFMTIDSKASDDKNAGTDFIGICINFVDMDNNWHLIAYQVKLSTRELVSLMFNFYEKYTLEKIGYEKTAFTEGMKSYLEEEQRKRNKFLPLVELHHRQQNKNLRIQQSLEPRYQSHAVFHLTQGGIAQCQDLIEQLRGFPKMPFDDVADATAYQSEIAAPPDGVGEDENYGLYGATYN